MERLTSQQLRLALRDEEEIALLDVREQGQYGEGHPFLAVNMPYSRLESEALLLLPCSLTRLVLLDDGDGVAGKSAAKLAGLGYRNLAILDGGVHAWAASGMTLFKGVNVPSKAFGELVEHNFRTPMLDPQDLKAWLDSSRRFVLVDCRTPAEHAKMTIPSAVSCPNAELGYRFPAFVSDDETPIVIHCAGRTRSIIGAETLRALGVRNPVYALRNGTQGWRLAGFELLQGLAATYPDIDIRTREASREQAHRLRLRFAVPTISRNDLAYWRNDPGRTLYVFDVRTEEEYRAGHLTGAQHAPGGQLVQATDHWIAARGARIVLVDDTGLRATLTAHWLRQMGHHATVLDFDVAQLTELEGRLAPGLHFSHQLPKIRLKEIPTAMSEGAVVLDLNPGIAYRAGHIAGARWAIRPRLRGLGLNQGDRVVLLSTDPRSAELVATDLREMGLTKLSHATGTVDDWRNAGLAVVATPDEPGDDDCIDYLFFVHDRHEGNMDAARQYLEWETNLINEMDHFDHSVFRLFWPELVT